MGNCVKLERIVFHFLLETFNVFSIHNAESVSRLIALCFTLQEKFKERNARNGLQSG